MFKILIFLIMFIPTSSFAITLGTSIGINFGEIKLTTKEKYVFNNKIDDSNVNVGFFYKYNWNIKKVIIGLEFFYDYLNIKNFFDISSINFRYRYGANLNLGYDITDTFSLYTIFGYSLIKYKAISDGINYFDKDNNLKVRPLYGFGIGYSLSLSWKINLEYNIQFLQIDLYDGISNYHFKNNLESIKFSIIYKF